MLPFDIFFWTDRYKIGFFWKSWWHEFFCQITILSSWNCHLTFFWHGKIGFSGSIHTDWIWIFTSHTRYFLNKIKMRFFVWPHCNIWDHWIRGRSQTTLTRFWLFWPPTPLCWHFLWYDCWQKVDILRPPTYLVL